MPRRHGTIVAVTTLAFVLLAAVTTAGDVGMWVAPEATTSTDTGASTPVERTAPPPDEPDRDDEATAPTFVLAGWVEAILRVVTAAAFAIGLIAALAAGWRRRPRLRWRPRRAPEIDVEVVPDVAGALADDAESRRAELVHGPPRNAIVRCWLRLEDDVTATGLSRRPSDTSAEFTERVLSRYAVDATAIRRLAASYREARFSEHPIDEHDRRVALDALDRLHRDLDAARARDASRPITSEELTSEVADAADTADSAGRPVRAS